MEAVNEPTFSIGEIAIVRRPGDAGDDEEFFNLYEGKEVQINSRLYFDPQAIGFYMYEVLSPDGDRWCATPHCLQKRRPPQDWKALCNLDSVPREEIPA